MYVDSAVSYAQLAAVPGLLGERVQCANTGRSPTACRTDHIDLERAFRIGPTNGREAPESGLPLKARLRQDRPPQTDLRYPVQIGRGQSFSGPRQKLRLQSKIRQFRSFRLSFDCFDFEFLHLDMPLHSAPAAALSPSTTGSMAALGEVFDDTLGSARRRGVDRRVADLLQPPSSPIEVSLHRGQFLRLVALYEPDGEPGDNAVGSRLAAP